MGVKGDKMADALEAYRGSWTLTLTNATGTTRLQLVVGARGSTKISGNVTDVSSAGKLSGKFVDDAGANWTLSAPAFDEYDPAEPSYSASVLCKRGKLATTATNPRTGATIAYTATCSSTLIPLGDDQYVVFLRFPPKSTATVSFPGCSLAIPITP